MQSEFDLCFRDIELHRREADGHDREAAPAFVDHEVAGAHAGVADGFQSHPAAPHLGHRLALELVEHLLKTVGLCVINEDVGVGGWRLGHTRELLLVEDEKTHVALPFTRLAARWRAPLRA